MPPTSDRETRLGRLLREHPEARDRLRRAVGWLLSSVLVTITAMGGLTIWHFRRRADRLRSRLTGCRGADPTPLSPRLSPPKETSE